MKKKKKDEEAIVVSLRLLFAVQSFHGTGGRGAQWKG